ncbi:MAG: helix-turn-helix domain-containing protein [Bacteroidaceae bacterium]|nr:helix-turn-helix domain-containing protein [Bacteroidaceae bacterium]MBR1379427.1 helix-turn-helix domain-containing protein [Bacteroidaceae bacterium]
MGSYATHITRHDTASITHSIYFTCALLTLLAVSLQVVAQSNTPNRLDVTTRTLPLVTRLPASVVNCIMQDSEGYIWYGTDGGGLCRDNGYQIDIMRSNSSHPHIIADNNVLHIAEAPHGQIWFSTNEGLYSLSKHDYSINRIDISSRNARVNDMVCDTSGMMWVAFADTILRINPDNHNIQSRIASMWGGEAREVMDLELTPDGSIWAVQFRGGIVEVVPNQASTTPITPSTPEQVIPEVLYADPTTGKIWMGTWGQGLYQLGDTSWIHMTDDDSDLNLKIQNIYISRDHTLLYTSTLGGIQAYAMTDGRLQHLQLYGYEVSDLNFVPGRLAADMFENIWVPSIEPQTFIISRSDKSIDHHELISTVNGHRYAANIKSMIAEGDTVWIHKLHTHLVAYDFVSQKEIPNPFFTSSGLLTKRHDGGVWATDPNRNIWGIFFDTEGVMRNVMGPTHTGRVSCMADDGCGHLYYACLGTLMRYNIDERTNDTISTGHGSIPCMKTDSHGQLYYISAEKGLQAIPPGGTEMGICTTGHPLALLAISATDSVWVIDEFGQVYSLQADTLCMQPSACSDQGDTYTDACFDNDGHLWLVADKYVKEYDTHRHAARKLTAYDPRIDMTSFIAITQASNSIMVGGVGGMIRLHSAEFPVETHAHDINAAVSTYVADGVVHYMSQDHAGGTTHFELSPDIGSLELRLTTFDHLRTSEIQFQYSIEGLTSGWTTLPHGENTIRLTNIGKGSYDVKVKVSEAGGPYSDIKTIAHFVRTPAWWETWWAYTLYILAAILIVAGIILTYLYIEYRKRQFNKLLLLLRTVVERQMLLEGRTQYTLPDSAKAEPDLTISTTDETTSHILEEEEISLSRLDRKFLDKAINAVITNIDDTTYGVDQLANDVCMSRSYLYRRLMTTTGQTPTDFIKTIRLERAASLLTNTTKSVAEIADLTGFSSASYFSKCFKKAYGVMPKHYKG